MKKTIVHKFFELNKKDRKMYMLQVTTINTMAIAIIKFIFGIMYTSIWFLSNAIFYVILSLFRYRSVRDYRRIKKELNIEKIKTIEYTNYFYNGWLLVLLGVAYLLINIFMYKTENTNNNLGGYLVYLVPLIAISSLITACISLLKYNRKKDPIIAAVCQSDIAKALTTIVLTQVVLLDEFAAHTQNIVKIDAITGIIVAGLIIFLGFRMIIKIIDNEKNNTEFIN